MPHRLFVSHSSRTPQDLERLRALCVALASAPAGHVVLVDRGYEFGREPDAPDRHLGEIVPDEDWSLRLDEWMAECTAAIVLFSTAALDESEWVKKEVAILNWRRRVDPAFRLFAVLLDGLAPEALNARPFFRVLDVPARQMIRGCASAAAIVAAAEERLGPGEPDGDTPYARLEHTVARILATGARDDQSLERAWDGIVAEGKPPYASVRAERFAAGLARMMIRDGRSAIRNLRQVLDVVRPALGSEDAHELLRSLRYLWVDAKAASRLPARPPVKKRGEPLRLAGGWYALNGDYLTEFTAEDYVLRAWDGSEDFDQIDVAGGAYDEHAIRYEIYRQLTPASRRMPEPEVVKRGPAHWPKQLKNLDRRLRTSPERPIFVVLAHDEDSNADALLDELTRTALHEHFPRLVFVAGTGSALPASVPGDVVGIEPALDPEVEDDVDAQREAIRRMLQKRGANP